MRLYRSLGRFFTLHELGLHRDAIDRAIGDLQDYGVGTHRLLELPKPERLDVGRLPGKQYHRLAVACELSFTRYNIGEIVPPHENQDKNLVHVRGRDSDQLYVSKDQA